MKKRRGKARNLSRFVSVGVVVGGVDVGVVVPVGILLGALLFVFLFLFVSLFNNVIVAHQRIFLGRHPGRPLVRVVVDRCCGGVRVQIERSLVDLNAVTPWFQRPRTRSTHVDGHSQLGFKRIVCLRIPAECMLPDDHSQLTAHKSQQQQHTPFCFQWIDLRYCVLAVADLGSSIVTDRT